MCVVLRRFCICHSERRPLAAALTDVMCNTQYTIIVPFIPIDGAVPQPSGVYTLLLEKFNVLLLRGLE